MTTLDRHLLMRFLHAVLVYLVAGLGLYVVVDGFINLDAFQESAGETGLRGLLRHMGFYYACQSSLLLEMFGPTAAIMGVTTTLALLSKHGELHPLLAAGVPTYRLCVPFLVGLVLINALLIANQELVIPRIAVHIQGAHGSRAEDARNVEPCLSAAGIFISGAELYLKDRRLVMADFRLSPGPLTPDHISIVSREAVYLPALRGPTGQMRPAGWLLRDARPRLEELPLTDLGRRTILPQGGSRDLFIVCEVTFEELYNRSASFKLLSTKQLLSRTRRPVVSTGNARAQLLHLHGRLMRPALMISALFLVFPILVRRESRSLVTDIGMCTLVMATFFGLTQALKFISQAGLLSPELATWLPLFGSAGASVWLAPLIKT